MSHLRWVDARPWLLALLAWFGSVFVLAPISVFAVLVLAGPHSAVLPESLQPLVLVLGWMLVLLAPAAVARMVWLRTVRRPVSTTK